MFKEFTKADLQYGYLVVLRNGNKAVYMPTIKGDYFDYMNNSECLSLDDYLDNLTYTKGNENFVSENYDVVKVYGYTACGFETTAKNINERTLLWEREIIKEMTMADLEKHFGCKVKIIKEIN